MITIAANSYIIKGKANSFPYHRTLVSLYLQVLALPMCWTPEWLGCLSIAGLASEQVLQALVNGAERFSFLLEQEQDDSVLHESPWDVSSKT